VTDMDTASTQYSRFEPISSISTVKVGQILFAEPYDIKLNKSAAKNWPNTVV